MGTAENSLLPLLLLTMTKLEKIINSLETTLGVINGEIYKGEDPAFVKGYSRSAIENALVDLEKIKAAL